MKVKYDLFREEDNSVTVEFDLRKYLPLFMQANRLGSALSTAIKEDFDSAHAALSSFFHDFQGITLMDRMMDSCLNNYTSAEQAQIQASPAYQLLYDSFREILKNTIDSFLEQHIRNPDDPSTTICLNLNIEKLSDQVRISFSDSGTGFPGSILRDTANEKRQLQYMQTHKISQKREQKTQGLLGGGAYGLRQLICQTLTGKELGPGTKPKRATHFTSEIHFKNNKNHYYHGASIEIVTQLAPIPEMESNLDLSTPLMHQASYSPETERTTASFSSGHTDFSSNLSTPTSLRSSQDSKSMELSIDIPSAPSHFQGNSPVIAKQSTNIKKSDSSKLSLDTSFDDEDTNRFAGTSPVMTKQMSRKQETRSERLESRSATPKPTRSKRSMKLPSLVESANTDTKSRSHEKMTRAMSERAKSSRNRIKNSTTEYKQRMDNLKPNDEMATDKHSRMPKKT